MIKKLLGLVTAIGSYFLAQYFFGSDGGVLLGLGIAIGTGAETIDRFDEKSKRTGSLAGGFDFGGSIASAKDQVRKIQKFGEQTSTFRDRTATRAIPLVTGI